MLLDDIATFLGTVSLPPAGWDLVKSLMPPSPDRVIVLFETGGYAPVTTSDFPVVTFQVRIRGAQYGYEEARGVAEQIIQALHNAEIAGYVYVYALQSAPVGLGVDQQANRPELSVNFRAMRAQF